MRFLRDIAVLEDALLSAACSGARPFSRRILMTIDIVEPDDRSIVDSAVESYLAGDRGETVRAYSGDLRAWTQWCTSSGVAPLAVTRAQIETYARTLQDTQGLLPATVARRVTTVCGFYRHCAAEDLIERNPGQFVRRPQVPSDSRTLGLTYLETAG
jgi:integrase/recombinase XerD